MDKKELNDYKRLFIRFCKNENTWYLWQKYFKKYHNFDEIINLCLPKLKKYVNNV